MFRGSFQFPPCVLHASRSRFISQSRLVGASLSLTAREVRGANENCA
jgi:hypothetical protein